MRISEIDTNASYIRVLILSSGLSGTVVKYSIPASKNLDIDFSIICGKLEKYREDILGSLIINVSSEHKEKIKKYLDEKEVRWEEIINED